MPLPSLAEVQAQLDILRTHQEYYAQAKDYYSSIPPDTKKALAKKWVSEAAKFTEGKLAAYELAHQEEDRKRLIPLPAVLRALQDLEEQLVQTQVLDLAQLMWRKFSTARRLYEALFVNWSGVWKILVEIWQFVSPPSPADLLDGYNQLVGGVAAVSAIGLEAFSAKAFIEVALSVAKERDKAVKAMRHKALPQRPAKRYRRRKRAR